MQGRSFPRVQRGVTLIECCMVLAIAGVLVGAAAPGFNETLNKSVAEGIAAELATDLRYVRSEAVARNEGVRISFYNGASGQCYLIHTGNRRDCRCDGPGPAVCSGDAVLLKTVGQAAAQPVKMVSNVGSMLFNADNGTTVPGGTICITAPKGKEIRHTVNIMGRVKSCLRPASSGSCEAC